MSGGLFEGAKGAAGTADKAPAESGAGALPLAVACPDCDDGTITETVAECCCRFLRGGSCCGQPIPAPQPAPCPRCEGTGKLSGVPRVEERDPNKGTLLLIAAYHALCSFPLGDAKVIEDVACEINAYLDETNGRACLAVPPKGVNT